jgi:thioredoxin-related protein
MKNFVMLLFVFLCAITHTQAQIKPGIRFDKAMSWDEVKAKARRENKYIFVDIYTTWCVPCRKMATEVFTQPKVGSFFNSQFINIALQTDKTKNDSKYVQSWYKTAAALSKTYHVKAYPTYLFFSPQGLLVHQIEGGDLNPDSFIAKSKEALDPKKQYAVLKQQFTAGKNDPKFLLSLVSAAQKANDMPLVQAAGNKYLLAQNNLLTANNLKLIEIATSKTTDPGFNVLRQHGSEYDAVIGQGKSDELINTIIFDEQILPVIRKGGTKTNYGGGMIMYSGEVNKEVDWQKLKLKIDSIIPERSAQIIMAAKPTYYNWLENHPLYIAAVSDYVKAYPNNISNDELCSYASTVLNTSPDPASLETALGWSAKTVSGNGKSTLMSQYIYSAILYKLNRKAEAIAFIEKASASSPETQKAFADLLVKMKNNKQI